MRQTRVLGAVATAALVWGVATPVAAATINGTDGNDVLVGTTGADTIRGCR
jgi:Ca2+-binding RTX toxin-like protein